MERWTICARSKAWWASASSEKHWNTRRRVSSMRVSWAYWNLKCGRVPAPPLPVRHGVLDAFNAPRREDVIRGQGRAFAKEVLVHLLDEELLGFTVAEVEPVFVHDHLHAVHPHLPGLLETLS